MKTKIFLPVELDGSINIPPMVVEHLGVNLDGLVAFNIPKESSCCIDCEELEISLTASCDENQCNGYSTDSPVVNIPQELLDIANIPIGAELTAMCENGQIVFVESNQISKLLEMCPYFKDHDTLVLQLIDLCELDD